jgi:CRP/FNR family transcriptional regulator
MPIGELGRNYENGAVIFLEDEPGDCMYYIIEGRVNISRSSTEGEVPIATLGEGEIFGEMALFDRLPRSATAKAHGETRLLTVDKKKFFSSISRDPTIAFKILEAMSMRTRRLNAEYMKARNEKFEALKAALHLEQVCSLVLDEAGKAVESDNGSIMLLDKDGETLKIAAAFGEEQPEKTKIKVGEGVAGKVFESGQAQMINDVSLSPLFKPGGHAINSILCVPLIHGDRKLGVLNLSSVSDKIFTMQDLKLIEMLASYSAIAIQSAADLTDFRRAVDELTTIVDNMGI